MLPFVKSPSRSVVTTRFTRCTRSGVWMYAGGRKRRRSTMLNIVALAPIPRASVTTTAAVKPGFRRRPRAAYRMSCQSGSHPLERVAVVGCRVVEAGVDAPMRCLGSGNFVVADMSLDTAPDWGVGSVDLSFVPGTASRASVWMTLTVLQHLFIVFSLRREDTPH